MLKLTTSAEIGEDEGGNYAGSTYWPSGARELLIEPEK